MYSPCMYKVSMLYALEALHFVLIKNAKLTALKI